MDLNGSGVPRALSSRVRARFPASDAHLPLEAAARYSVARMADPPLAGTPTITALDRATLERALECDTRSRLALELPAFRRHPRALSEVPAATGLVGARGALFVVTTPDGTRFCAEAWCPDVPEVATTLRVAVAPLDASEAAPALEVAALGRLLTHLMQTTTAVRFERCVPASDARAASVCRDAGLALECVRARATLVRGRPADAAVFVAFSGYGRAGGAA